MKKKFYFSLLILMAVFAGTSWKTSIFEPQNERNDSGPYVSADKYTSLKSAVESVRTDRKVLVILRPEHVASDLTVPENISLLFVEGGLLTILDGTTLTINGHMEAGYFQIFNGSGKVVLNRTDYIYPQWWGAKGDNLDSSAGANRTAIQAAVYCASRLPGGGGMVRLLSGKYRIDDEIKIPAGVSLEGVGSKAWASTTIFSNKKKTKNILVFNHDGHFAGHSSLKNISLSGGLTGIKIKEGSWNYFENVQVQGCAKGIYVYNSLWNTFVHVDTYQCDIGLHLEGKNAQNVYSNNNTFIGCKFRYSSEAGITINRGAGNIFVGCNFENNKGLGLKIDNQSEFISATRLVSSNGGHLFENCWFEANGAGAIHLVGDQNTLFLNANIYNSEVQLYGVVRLERTRKIRFRGGKIIDYCPQRRYFHIGYGCFDTVIDIDNLAQGSATDFGIGTRFGHLLLVKSNDMERITLNQTFNVLEKNGRDVFANWKEVNNHPLVGSISADPDDLIRPRTFSQYSCKLEVNAMPGNTMSIMQKSTLSPSTKYYVVIEYKNDSAQDRINSPLSVLLHDETNKKYWDFNEDVWSGSTRLAELPLSVMPTAISLPFISPSAAASIRLQISNYQSWTNASHVTHHIYSAAVQRNREPNPAPDNTAPPKSGIWNQGDEIVNTAPEESREPGKRYIIDKWKCITGGTPGIWIESRILTGN